MQRLVVRRGRRARARRRGPASRSCICSARFEPPTCARICSSGNRRSSTVSRRMLERGEDDRAGVDQRAVEIEEDDREAHALNRRQRATRYRPQGGAVCPASLRGRPSRSGARSTPSTIVPTSVRTMCRRKESAVISNASTSPSSTQRAASTTRANDLVLGLGRRERAEVVLARRAARPAPRRRATSSGRGCHQLRSRSNGERGAPRQIAVAVAARPRREAGVEVRRRLARRRRRRRRRAAPRSAPRRRASAGGPPSTSTLATFASACTPASVRPATARPLQLRNDRVERRAAARPRRCASPGCAAQPRKPVPSYASVSFSRTSGALPLICQAFLMLY